ncbi:type II toxin-antitoxin system RelE family toxin [Niabella ginsengisoli]|uniref:Type II toxin-antitoxin system RelE/ParE family toxin n=1 Tax=Niabella ginsengisoli TaxID=522298 RepID=A0ABS9SIE8_9BACT|nr:hypothetical protein [Niabella ginsengisoli]MCH5598115.1 hypothetical protein [Niabella ginsengisoli]
MQVIPKKLFIKEVENIPKSYRDKILKMIMLMQEAKELNEITFLEKLSGYKTYYKIRIGYLRVGVEIDLEHTIHLITCKKRGDIYKHFP